MTRDEKAILLGALGAGHHHRIDNPHRRRRALRRLLRRGLLAVRRAKLSRGYGRNWYRLTPAGAAVATRMVREGRVQGTPWRPAWQAPVRNGLQHRYDAYGCVVWR